MLSEKVNALEQKLDAMHKLLLNISNNHVQGVDDWLKLEDAKKLTGLGTTTLWELRRKGILEFSSITGKEKFIRRSSIVKLLNKQETELQNRPLIKPIKKQNDTEV